MKLEIILIIAISGIMLTSLLQQANSELLSSGEYLLQGNGYVTTESSIEDSQLNLQLATSNNINNRMKINLEDGLISISDDDYVASKKWTGTTMSNGRFLLLSGSATNGVGDKISLNLFGRLVQHSDQGSVYTITGKLTKDNESMKVVYTAKIVGTNLAQGTTEKPKPTQEKTIQISILSGSSKRETINYYSPNTLQITPGTTIIWKNDDSVSHTILSGVASFSHGKPFKPDGKINSGEIAPGQTFRVTLNDLGITRFFDDKYSWMDGAIISLPAEKSTSLKTKETALEKAQKYRNP